MMRHQRMRRGSQKEGRRIAETSCKCHLPKGMGGVVEADAD